MINFLLQNVSIVVVFLLQNVSIVVFKRSILVYQCSFVELCVNV
jgi:hypothetical protein